MYTKDDLTRITRLWHEAVFSCQQRYSLSRQRATAKAIQEHPELHNTYLKAFNDVHNSEGSKAMLRPDLAGR